jgi:serine/threonine protein kinase
MTGLGCGSLEGARLPRISAPETIAWGADGEVRLRGDFAFKRFRRPQVYEHEARVLKQLPQHPCLIRILTEDDDTCTLRFARYCTDLMRCLLAEQRVPAARCCVGLASAVAHCHRAGLVHRDIKPENVLLDRDFSPVLCDFSRALFAPEPLYARFAGTRAYAAPEALRGCCCLVNDVWSMAVVFFCVVEVLFPFDSDDEGASASEEGTAADKLEFQSAHWHGVFERRLRAQLPQCFCVNPDRRPAARQVLEALRLESDEEGAARHVAGAG